MITVPGYQILAQIDESAISLVYRGIRERDGQPVILKRLKKDYPTLNELARYKREYEITRSLNLEGVVKAYDLEKYQNALVMCLEDFGGESLKVLMAKRKFTLSEFLTIAIKIADVLGKIHAINIIHRDINPSNIVFSPASGQLKITNFAIATRLTFENPILTKAPVKNPNVLEGTLAYMSPEQTGRMNRSLDYRTDFYSLGATLYELLAGQLPFETQDALELVHFHIAIAPIPPAQLNPDIPKAVSDIVMKLLAKNADDRYQSAWGIKADLMDCLWQLERHGKIEEIILGTHDVSDKFLIPQELYGREREIDTLLTAFEWVSNGQSELMLVSGYSGIGKSSLVAEMYKPITWQRGYFISGKFDQYQRNIPYYAIIQAFQELVKQLLTESETQLESWRKKLRAALSTNAHVIIDVIPEVELLTGPQPAVPELETAESQKRFHQVFKHFVRVFSQPSHPLVLFLDNLQWADSATLELIELLVTDSDILSLFLIGAYRDNEVSAAHPLMLTIDEIKHAGGCVNQIELSPLDDSGVNQFICDTLKCTPKKAQPLAELVLAKTQGNPFFIKEFLKSLYAEKLLYFDVQSLAWQWDIKQIQARGFTDNVVELMTLQIQKLPAIAQQVLQLAAAIGNQFELNTLAIVYGKSLQETALGLHAAVAEGLVLPVGDAYGALEDWELESGDNSIQNPYGGASLRRSKGAPANANGSEFLFTAPSNFKIQNEAPNHQSPITNYQSAIAIEYQFAHDRIQQAAYSLIQRQDKPAIHLKVGQLLLEHTPANEREQKIFEIVNQLNLGIEALCSMPNPPLKRDELARLNLIAGDKAKASGAYQSALKYFQAGIELLGVGGQGGGLVQNAGKKSPLSSLSPLSPPSPLSGNETAKGGSEGGSSWLHAYDLTLRLFVEAAEAAFLSGDYKQQDKLVDVVLQQAKTLLDKVKVYEVKIQSYIAQSKLKEAVETALAVLKLLGMTFPSKPSKLDVWLSFLRTKLALRSRSIEDLVNLPPMTAPNKLAAMGILSSVASAAYFVVPELMLLIVFKQVNLSIKYGNSPLSASAYSSYGMILCDFEFDIDAGYRFGQLALKLLSKLNVKGSLDTDPTTVRTVGNVHYFIRPWKEHINSTLQPILEAYSTGLETGELEFAAYAAHNYCVLSYFSGKELEQLQQEMEAYGDAISQLKQERTLRVNKLYRQVILNLRGSQELKVSRLKVEGDAPGVATTALLEDNLQPCNLQPSTQTDPCCLSGELYDESQMLPLHKAANHRTAICLLHFNKLILCYLFESFHQAVENADIAEEYLDALRGTIIVPLFHFYDSLTALAVYAEASRLQQNRILKKVNANQKKMKKWAHHAPMNHLHKFYLVEAERYRVLGRVNQAAECYDRAIEEAKKHEYLQEEALAHELAAKFYLANNKIAIAQAYMLNAHYCYQQWGAKAKVKDLEERYSQLLARYQLRTEDSKTTSLTTSTGSGEALDLAAVMKASQAISGEIVLGSLLANLMKILIENAGAQTGFLILPTKDDRGLNSKSMLIEAEGFVIGIPGEETCATRVLQSTPIGSRLPASIVNYVARTQETVVLNDATREDKFTNDPYIKQNQPKSILCWALLNQGKLSGIVYLENNLTPDAFTPDRLEVLKLLSSQAAISIENAKLYSELRQRESQLNQFLEAIPVGVGVLDASGKPYYLNQMALQLIGKGAIPSATLERLSEVYQFYIAGTEQLYPSENLPSVRALKGESASTDDIELHRGEKIIPLEVWGTPIYDESGNITYAIAAYKDITERKKAEIERIKFTQELTDKNIALQEMDQLKDEFLKNISHELRTPLNGIISSIKLILDGFCDDRDEEIEFLQQVDQSAIRLLDIIDRILDLNKIKTGRGSVELTPVDLHACLAKAIELQQSKLKEKKLQLHRHDFKEPLLVQADAIMLKQVFFQIIDNAIKFTDSGSITITTGLELAANNEEGIDTPMAIATIQDTGIGIDPSQQHKLFQPFVMVDGSTTRSQGGVGLGLVLSRSLMEKMGGTITLESAGKNQGTTVAIALPLDPNYSLNTSGNQREQLIVPSCIQT
jgi:PAS domain S-box-containing protein